MFGFFNRVADEGEVPITCLCDLVEDAGEVCDLVEDAGEVSSVGLRVMRGGVNGGPTHALLRALSALSALSALLLALLVVARGALVAGAGASASCSSATFFHSFCNSAPSHTATHHAV